MTANRGFHLGWVDVEPSRENQFLFTVSHRDEAVAVDPDVTGLEPPLGGKDARTLLGCVQVPSKDLRTTNDNLSRLAVLNVERIVVERDETQLRGREWNAENTMTALV